MKSVTREKYSPRQIYTGVKLAYADFTPPPFPPPDILPINTRELHPRELYSPCEICG